MKRKSKPGSITLPKQAIQAAVDAGTFDAEAGTVDVVWSSGARVRFWDWEVGDYDLTLGLDKKNVDLTFARQGAPVLDSHARYSVSGVVGVVDAIDVDGKQGTATLRFSKRPEVEPIAQDVADGILRFVSVGTRLHKLKDITEEGDPVPHYLAELHEPLEISLAPVPADRGAVIQSEKDEERFPVEIVSQSARAAHSEGGVMKPKATKAAREAAEDVELEVTKQTEGETEPAPEPKAAASEKPAPERAEQREDEDVDKIAKQAAEAERKRGAAIRKVVRQAKLSEEFADGLIESGATLDQARAKVLDKLAEQSDSVPIRGQVSVVHDEADTIRQSVASALLHRVRPASFALEARGNEWVGMSLLEVGRELLAQHGISTRGMSRQRVAEMAFHSTSDFPEILANVANKTLRQAYSEVPRTFTAWARETTLPDFKQVSRTQLGEAPNLTLVGESGEFKYGSIGEAAEKYALATYGKIVGFTRQSMVNDDLGAFTGMVAKMAAAAARLQSDLVYAIITSNPDMGDGTALFDSDHGNISGGAGAISITTLGAGRAAMRKQVGVDGSTLINVAPRYLLVPAALETIAEQFTTQISPDASGNVNPFSGQLQVVAEPRLDAASATVWYLVADPGQAGIDTIEYAFLEGQTGPYTETRMGFEVDGMEFKVRLDFAAKAIDWRGFYRNSA